MGCDNLFNIAEAKRVRKKVEIQAPGTGWSEIKEVLCFILRSLYLTINYQ